MIPLHFGTRQRLLFGAYTPAAREARRRGVVICNPWGAEALRSHRSLKVLADSLAREGLDVLRFDYYGTGDSWGGGEEVSLAGFVQDALHALEELRAVAAVERVDLVGLRLGAHVAAAAAQAAGEAMRVVLWDPVARGSQLLEELLPGRDPVEGPEPVEAGGFVLPPAFRDELRAASLAGLPGARARVLVAVCGSSADGAPWDMEGSDVTTTAVGAPPCWIEERDFGAGAVPVELLRVITEWLS